MSTILPAVAKNVYYFCKKCDQERYFKVITHTSPTTAKIKCEVCGAHKSYNLEEVNKPASERGKAKTGRASKSKDTKGGISSTWLTLKEKHEKASPVGYKVNQRFADNDSIMHPVFGLGFVTKTFPAKIEVLFSEGIKELIHSKN
jgi:MinD superfamily P-loop ATPase